MSTFPRFPELIWQSATACVEAARKADVIARARAVDGMLDGFEATRDAALPEPRRSILDELRRRLQRLLEEIPLGEPDGPARAATALELFVSLGDSPPRPDADFPGLREREHAVAPHLGIDREMRRRLRHRLLFEHYGDMLVDGRPPHALRTLFDLTVADEPVVSDRARRLSRALLLRRMSGFDHFLWFHLRRRDREGTRALFAANEGGAVGAAVRDLLGDDVAFAAMVADEDLRHGGRTRLTLGARDHAGLDQLRRLVQQKQPARWVDLAGGLDTYHRERAPGMVGLPTIAVDLVRADADGLENLVPLMARWDTHVDPWEGEPWMGARLLDDAEIAAFRATVEAAPIEARPANLLHAAELAAAVPHAEGPTLYTLAAYLVSIRPQDDELRRRARAEGLSGPRVGALQMIENVLALLRPGDLLSLAGRSVVPYLRGVAWLNADVDERGALRVRGVGQRIGYPGFRLRWELS
jgi:hypothetical protein